MVKYLYISIFLLIFAIGIVGGHVPMTRAKLAPPFPFVYLGQDLERVSEMSKRSTTEDFVKKATLVHNGKYNYDKVNYVSRKEYVCMTCPIHGDFWRTPAQHITSKLGCAECKKEELRGQREASFLSRSTEIHKGVYGYSLVNYVNTETPVMIECSKHGVFMQTPHEHLGGCGCPTCGNERNSKRFRMPQEEFIARAKKVHGENYDYSLVKYKNNNEYVDIKCNKCGKVFQQVPSSHLAGHGCPFCADRVLLTTEEFIRRAVIVHKDKYDYTQVEYKGCTEKVTIKCNTCGNVFEQVAYSHLNGAGCNICALIKSHETLKLPIEEWKKRAQENHIVNYDYSRVSYNNLFEKVWIGCPMHGWFQQEAKAHMQGNNCPYCSVRSKGEDKIRNYLDTHNIEYHCQYRFPNEYLMSERKNLVVDFYIPSINTVIEYNGRQHYMEVDLFGGQETFEKQQERDYALRQYCREHKIRLLEISYKEYKNIDKILKRSMV